MQFQRPVTWSILLLACARFAPAADQPAQIPEHYAEVVLHVEGMI